MPPKKGEVEAIEVPPLREGVYDYDLNESLALDIISTLENEEEGGDGILSQYAASLDGQAETAKIFPGNYLAYCALACAYPHPSIWVPPLYRKKIYHGESKEEEGGEEKKQDTELSSEEAVSDKPIEKEHFDGMKSVVIKNQVVDTTSLLLLLLSLKGNTEITELHLFNVALNKSGFEVLAKELPSTNITTLSLDYNPFHSFAPKTEAEENGSDSNTDDVNKFLLSSILGEESKLNSLSLRGNHIDSKLIQQLGEKLALNVNLQSLNLFDNDIDNEGFESLLKTGLQSNKTVENLSISNNKISSFNELVANFPLALKYLNVAQNDKIELQETENLLQSLAEIKDTHKSSLKSLCLKNCATKLMTVEMKDKIKTLSEEHGIEINF